MFGNAYSISEIKTFIDVDLDKFEIRGAKMGIGNAQTTGVLYTRGTFDPYSTMPGGTAVLYTGDSTVRFITFNAPYSHLNALSLYPGDLIEANAQYYSIKNVIDSNTVVLTDVASVNGTTPVSFQFKDRDYLIEPDSINNTTYGSASFVNGSSIVTGLISWGDLSPGDIIQLNTYQKYFTIDSILDTNHLELTQPFDGDDATGFYTTKRWRLDRLNYQYVKNDFTYEKNRIRWDYDSTTNSNLSSSADWRSLVDGVEIKFSPTLNPTRYPDVMDSNSVLNKTFTQSTDSVLAQYSLPAVPDPEESLTLYINDIKQDRFPDGNMDYVLNYWQNPTYEYPPPPDERRVANIMFLKRINDMNLNPTETQQGIILFKNLAGEPVPGIMPGSELIKFNDTDQTANLDYVLDLSTGLGYSSQHITNESVVKYVAYIQENLFDHGINIYLDGTRLNFTIPHDDNDQVLFEFESGRLKPVDKNNPALGEEYIVEYLTEADYVSNEGIITLSGDTFFQVKNYPVADQSVILVKNGIVLDENSDYRVSCMTGLITLFTPVVRGDVFEVNYQALNINRNGLSFRDNKWFCKTYGAISSVFNTIPLEFTITNTDLVMKPVLNKAYNVTKAKEYDITAYTIRSQTVTLQQNPINVAIATDLTDVIELDYSVEKDGVEYTPVVYINLYVEEGSDFICFVDTDLTSVFTANSFIRLTNTDSAGDFFFKIDSVEYVNGDTLVNLQGRVPLTLINPVIYVSDAPVEFDNTPMVSDIIVSGSTDVSIPGLDISRYFRTGKFLNIGDDYYYIRSAEYDPLNSRNIIKMGVEAYYDYTSASILSNLTLSDCPIYYEGDIAISTSTGIITDPNPPAMILNYDGLVTINSDSSSFSVDFGTDQSSFLYSAYPTVSDLATALTGVGLRVQSYVSDWTCSKIVPITNAVVVNDSSTLVNIIPALRYNSVDTTEFSLEGNALELNNPLYRMDRYDLDYLGLSYLGDSTVNYSASYFTALPVKSKISASLNFKNLDQFYIQVMSRRNFLGDVIEPKMKQEALQQSGSVGQGGELAGDDNAGNSSGGLYGDEYRRADAVIESTIYNEIFDFFNKRLKAFGDEEYSIHGWKLLNNDGVLSSVDESMSIKAFNRIFPWADYTGFSPYTANPITGEAISYAIPGLQSPPNASTSLALFTPGSPYVTCANNGSYPTYWTNQLKDADYIKPWDATKRYEISNIGSDTSITLTTPYDGTSVLTTPLIMISRYPLYDDDGHMGGKLVGSKSKDFGLEDGDTFTVEIDGTSSTCTFNDPNPLIIPPPFNLLFLVRNLTGKEIASRLDEAFVGARVSWEWTFDSSSTYGYRDTLVIRTEGTYNKIEIISGDAVEKLGFVPGSISFGNMNNTDSNPEYPHTVHEAADLGTEQIRLYALLALTNRLDRASPGNLTLITDEIRGSSSTMGALHEKTHNEIQIPRITDQIAALDVILQEPSLPSYPFAVIAHDFDTTYLENTVAALPYNSTFINYEAKGTPARWVLDIQAGVKTINGLTADGEGVNGGYVTPIIGESTFFITVEEDGTNLKRFLDATIAGDAYVPVITDSTGTVIPGTWSGFNSGGPSPNFYSDSTRIDFTIDSFPLFTLSYSTPVATSNASQISIDWGVASNKTYLYSTYTTIGALKGELSNMYGLVVSGDPIHDGSGSVIIEALGPLSLPVTFVYDTTDLFTLNADTPFDYDITKTGLNISWGSSSKMYDYITYSTVADTTAAIKSEIAGIDAVGLGQNIPSGYIITPSTSITTNVIYESLRESLVTYSTMDDRLLNNRTAFVDFRKGLADERVIFMDDRDDEIVANITAEAYLQSETGMGNLYIWANNRFNRSNGCEARLNQIKKMMEMNQSSLTVSKIFI